MRKTVIKSLVLLSAILVSCSSLNNSENTFSNEQISVEQSQKSSSNNDNQTSEKQSGDFYSLEIKSSDHSLISSSSESSFISSISSLESSSSITETSSNNEQSSKPFQPLTIPDNTFYVRSGTACLGTLISEEALLINDFETFNDLLIAINYEASINTETKRHDERINDFCSFIDGIDQDFFVDKYLLFTMPMEVTYFIDDFKLQLVASGDDTLNLYYKYVHSELNYTYIPPSGYLFDAFAIKKEKPIKELNVRVTSPDGGVFSEYHQDFAKK